MGAISNERVELKAYFSNTGPRIDIWAPGVAMMGGYSNNAYEANSIFDPRNPSYFLNKISGTSQACPQVVGVAALLSQMRPYYNQSQILNWIINLSSLNSNLNDTGSYTSPYTFNNVYSVQGGTKNILYFPYTSSVSNTIVGSLKGNIKF